MCVQGLINCISATWMYGYNGKSNIYICVCVCVCKVEIHFFLVFPFIYMGLCVSFNVKYSK